MTACSRTQDPNQSYQKHAYFWAVTPDADHNNALQGSDGARKVHETMLDFQRNGVFCVAERGIKNFYVHLRKMDEKSTPIDICVISAHGDPITLGGFYLHQDEIKLSTKKLSLKDQAEFFRLFYKVLATADLIFASCSTGNKSIPNIAQKFSQKLPNARIFASQHVVNGFPLIMLDEKQRVLVVAHSIENQDYPEKSVQYLQGQEITHADPVPIDSSRYWAAWFYSSKLCPEWLAQSEEPLF